MQLVSRADWGARPARNQTLLVRSQQHGTAVHYSAADADEQADHANCARRVRAIQDFHMDGRGWADIAYSYLACKHGFVYEGRGRGIRTAAQGTNAGNDGYHAVCFLGDDTPARDDVTDAGREAIRGAVEHCNAWSGADGVRPHSDFHATACPGDQLRAWLEAGMPVTVQEEPDMTLTAAEHDALMWLRANLVGVRDQGVRMTDHGDPDTPGRANNLAVVRTDLAALQATLQAAPPPTPVRVDEAAAAAIAQNLATNADFLREIARAVADEQYRRQAG